MNVSAEIGRKRHINDVGHVFEVDTASYTEFRLKIISIKL